MSADEVTLTITLKKIGPLPPGRFSEKECVACHRLLGVGSLVTLIPVGPGEDWEDQKLARSGLSYTSAAVPAHWACATGFLT